MERDRKKEEKKRAAEAKRGNVYGSHIDAITYDNNAYVSGGDTQHDESETFEKRVYTSGTKNRLPDFIPPPPPPPESNGYAVSSKVKAKKPPHKAQLSKQQKRRAKQEQSVTSGGSMPTGYYDKVVDSEFGFINDESYAGSVL